MRRIELIVFIVFFLSIIINYKFIIFGATALVSGVVSLQVPQLSIGTVGFAFSSLVPINTTANFSVNYTNQLKNYDNGIAYGNMTINITHTQYNLSVIFNDSAFALGINQTRAFNATWKPFLSGNYLVRAIVYHDNIITEANGTMTVTGDSLILLNMSGFVQIGNSQTITSQFINTAPVDVTSKTDITVYFFDNTSLKAIANYFDNSVVLGPAQGRTYTIVYTPNMTGLYYVKAKATYSTTKVTETWGAFNVHLPAPQVIVVPPPASAPSPPLPVPRASLNYPQEVKFFQGDSTIFNITAKNTGEVTLTNLKLFVSTTSLINFSVNPKVIGNLPINNTAIFLVSVDVPEGTPAGTYAFDFVLSSDQVKDSRKILLKVSQAPPTSAERDTGLELKILNYKLLISEIEQEILAASLRGANVTAAAESLQKAKLGLRSARDYLDAGRPGDAEIILRAIRSNMEDAVMQLASSELTVKVPAAVPYWILPVLLVSAMAFFAYNYYKKRRQKPRLLRTVAETES